MYDYSKGNIDTLGDGGCLTYVLTLGRNIASSKSRGTKMIKQFTNTMQSILEIYIIFIIACDMTRLCIFFFPQYAAIPPKCFSAVQFFLSQY